MKKAKPINKIILFLYEGETDKEFYNKIFLLKLSGKGIRMHKMNLKGGINNKNVADEIYGFQIAPSNKNKNEIHVFIGYDRERRRRETPLRINIELLNKDFVNVKNSNIKSINQIIATQDLESWLFIDIEGIYKFLIVPKANRNIKKYANIENFNNKDLSKLFRQFGAQYQKGKRVEKFIDKLDLTKIYTNCPDLRKGIKSMIKYF